MSEVACPNGKHCVDTFLDLETFYDSIDNVKLVQQTFQLKWNPVVLYMSLLVHMAPRVLRFGDLWGEWISPCNSILQGCGSSNSWAGALLYKSLQDLHSRFPVQIGHQPPQSRHLCSSLTLSQNKSMVVASHAQLLRAVRRELLEQMFSFEGADSVRDVGLDANAGH